MTSTQERKIRQTCCDARFDNLTRQLYATDASIYQIEPVGVAFPRSAQQASVVIRAAADAALSVTPRGAGTSLVGNAIGEGLIVDFSRYTGRSPISILKNAASASEPELCWTNSTNF